MWCYVVVQANVPQMTDMDVSEMVASVLSLCDINFAHEQWITQDQLKAQLKGMTDLEFGKQNHKAYKNLMIKAEGIRAKLMGAPTWIEQCLSQSSTPQPAIEDARDSRPWVTDSTVTTRGAAYERGPIALWTDSTGGTTWDAWA